MNKLRTEKGTAVTVGVLYILATAAGGVSAAVAGALRSLDELAAHQAAALVGALALVVMAVACMGVAAMLDPILRRNAATPTQHGLAVWYLGTRISEATLILVGVTVLLAFFDYAWIAGQTIFGVVAAMLYWLLLRSGRVPRWLALWLIARGFRPSSAEARTLERSPSWTPTPVS